MHTSIYAPQTTRIRVKHLLPFLLLSLWGWVGSGCAPELLTEGTYVGTLIGHQVGWEGSYNELMLDATLSVSDYDVYSAPEDLGDAVVPGDGNFQQAFLLEGVERSFSMWFGDATSFSLHMYMADESYAYSEYVETAVDISAAHGDLAGTCMADVSLSGNATLHSNQEFEFQLFLSLIGTDEPDTATHCASQYGVPQTANITGILTYQE